MADGTSPAALEAAREAAIRNGFCATKARLKNELRLKPARDATPVAVYRNQYGGHSHVYRAADCVPMRAAPKRQSPAQKVAARRLALQSRLTSYLMKASVHADRLLAQDPVFLDVETTGLTADDEVVEIAVCDRYERVLLHTLVNPRIEVSEPAQAVHGLSGDMLHGAPRFSEVVPRLLEVIAGRPVVAFNADFDRRLVSQSLPSGSDAELGRWPCAMELAAQAFGPTNDFGTISLIDAMDAADLPWPGRAHRATADAMACARLVNRIASHHRPISEELDSLSPASGV